MWNEITYSFPKFNGIGYVTSPYTLLGMWLLIHDQIKVNPS